MSLKRLAVLSSSGMRRWLERARRLLSNNRAERLGISVVETITDINTDTDMATPISLKSWPTGSFSKITGTNTTTVVSAEPRIGAQTCLAP